MPTLIKADEVMKANADSFFYLDGPNICTA